MNYAEIKKFDIANSPYIGSSIFFSGCNFHCRGCFNEIAQDFNYGKPYTKEIEDEFIKYLKHDMVKNANILGGEPFQQDLNKILTLVKRIKSETNVGIWIWSGNLFENLIKDKKCKEILKYIDFLVDGQFKMEERDLNLKYRGSSNQRVIDVQKSLKENKIIEKEFE
ncbi:anaerobic ribonucleoside-triphosphate reductase activating protein [Clostridium perfringens]|uniref:anaerobic ribonucleoside-triphosphate reductase activating protein n=1 Tax=Clostridium perfringens TaxID=1502 RepID=UPI001ABBCF2F|nr:anaerobic ribonucleoside-triphosphate reductase activating protein [Clostridium perfringens]EGT3619587.1 anaerobic ribonucleoside-triphosphate reductase activating protein [Clostridium perfringens]MBO3398417.1 anaerobic ribonucleoside-triphosphate reductase activating protein [Clostridium perfringens]